MRYVTSLYFNFSVWYSKRYDVKECATHGVYWVNLKFTETLLYRDMYSNMYISWWVYFVTGSSYVLQQPSWGLVCRIGLVVSDHPILIMVKIYHVNPTQLLSLSGPYYYVAFSLYWTFDPPFNTLLTLNLFGYLHD